VTQRRLFFIRVISVIRGSLFDSHKKHNKSPRASLRDFCGCENKLSSHSSKLEYAFAIATDEGVFSLRRRVAA
jgi:hypothetical protein